MKSEDKEAFEKWINDSSSLSSKQVKMFREMSEQERIEFALEQGWQAACEYKQKEIDELYKYVERLSIIAGELNLKIKAMEGVL